MDRRVGLDDEGKYREPGEIGDMPFNRTLSDWASFDIMNRTKFDASISSGLAVMGTQRSLYLQPSKHSKIRVTFARYSNEGHFSKIIHE